jgi:hypothetical protein
VDFPIYDLCNEQYILIELEHVAISGNDVSLFTGELPAPDGSTLVATNTIQSYHHSRDTGREDQLIPL